jgi:hypothetical protein
MVHLLVDAQQPGDSILLSSRMATPAHIIYLYAKMGHHNQLEGWRVQTSSVSFVLPILF